VLRKDFIHVTFLCQKNEKAVDKSTTVLSEVCYSRRCL